MNYSIKDDGVEFTLTETYMSRDWQSGYETPETRTTSQVVDFDSAMSMVMSLVKQIALAKQKLDERKSVAKQKRIKELQDELARLTK